MLVYAAYQNRELLYLPVALALMIDGRLDALR